MEKSLIVNIRLLVLRLHSLFVFVFWMEKIIDVHHIHYPALALLSSSLGLSVWLSVIFLYLILYPVL